MEYAVEVVQVDAAVMASVRQRVPWSELSRLVPQILGEVWAVVRATPALKPGHNVAVYHDPNRNDVEVECGVQVTGDFTDSGRVRHSQSPWSSGSVTLLGGPSRVRGAGGGRWPSRAPEASWKRSRPR